MAGRPRQVPLHARSPWLAGAVMISLSLAGVAAPVAAQDAVPGPPTKPVQATTLPAVRVNASRLFIAPFDVPAALSVVDIAPVDAGHPGINLSEALIGIPGILARDRQNHAQDEQLSIRGFGGRVTFGVRSVRLYVDGIPATLPDGQGQVAHFNLDSADRVEVLRGPFSVLYGNAAGGVVQLWTAEGTAVAQTTLGVLAGSNDAFRYSANTRGMVGPIDYNIAASKFIAGGYRQHSRVNRESDNARFGIDLGQQRKLVVLLNRFDQPRAQDPLGLTRAQVDADPRQATPVASQYDTRKNTRQTQLGVVYEQQTDDADQWRGMLYHGQRRIVQFLSIPPAVQRNPLQAGGVVAPDTDYGGTDLRWTHGGQLADRDYQWVLGASADYQHQRRLGFENFLGDQLGVAGKLRRNENDNVYNVDEYAQWYWHFARRWFLLLGVRHSVVHFNEQDLYVTPDNPDDSGHARYAATTPVLGVQFRPVADVRIYASYGQGFETPSYSELGYRSDGQAGLAFNLRPARSRQVEVGAKWQAARALQFAAAVFRADTRDELAVATNQNGRSTYRNVGKARRAGAELSLTGQLGDNWRLSAGFTHLRARFRSGFLACAGTPCTVPDVLVAAGSRLPGVPDNYGSLRLEHGAELGWRAGVTLTAVAAVTVNDVGTQRAAGYGVVGADASYTFALAARTRLQLSASVGNLTDRRYIGTVIVNDGNGRYFEPGPDRTWMLGARLVL